MLPLTKKLIKRLPGLRRVIAQRDALLAQRDGLLAEREVLSAQSAEHERLRDSLARERRALRSALGSARLPVDALRPDFGRDRPRLERAAGEFFDVASEVTGFADDDAVLEVGCRLGTLAARFEKFLAEVGEYHGMDIDPAHVAVCRDAITDPRFSFATLDVRNERLNPHGRLSPRQFALPFDDERFDIVVVRSLFTQSYPKVIEHWLAEISRTLKAGGRCAAGFYLLNEDVERRLAGGDKASRSFSFDYGAFRVDDDDQPLKALAVPEAWVRGVAAGLGMEVVEPIRFGRWVTPGGPYSLDVVGFVKRG